MNDIYVIQAPQNLYFLEEVLTYKLPGEYQSCSMEEIKQSDIEKKNERFFDKKNREFFIYKDDENVIYCLGARPIYELTKLQNEIEKFGKYKKLVHITEI